MVEHFDLDRERNHHHPHRELVDPVGLDSKSVVEMDVDVVGDDWDPSDPDVDSGPVRHLGTFVYPRTPFPYFFPINTQLDESDAPKDATTEKDQEKEDEERKEREKKYKQKWKPKPKKPVKEEKDKKVKEKMGDEEKAPTIAEPIEVERGNDVTKVLLEDQHQTQPPTTSTSTRATIIIPTAFIPITKPTQPSIWGGGSVHLGGRKGGRRRRPQRIYTDDSDLFLCGMHAGWFTWNGARKAREEGKDLRIEVRLVRCGAGTGFRRFLGGQGERCFVREEGEGGGGDDDDDDDGRGVVSAGWGSGHDGSGIEIIKAEFIEVGFLFSSKNRFLYIYYVFEYCRKGLLGVLVCGTAHRDCSSMVNVGLISLTFGIIGLRGGRGNAVG